MTLYKQKYSSVYINESKVFHETEVSSFLTARRSLIYASFDTFGAKIGRLFTQQSVFKVSSEIDICAM